MITATAVAGIIAVPRAAAPAASAGTHGAGSAAWIAAATDPEPYYLYDNKLRRRGSPVAQI
jgi:hypothetical protein